MKQFLWIWMWSHQHKPDVRLQRTWYKGGGPRGMFYLQPHLIPLLHKRPLKCVCCICGNPLEEKVNQIKPDWLVNSWELLGQQRPTWVPMITSACSRSWNLGVPSRENPMFPNTSNLSGPASQRVGVRGRGWGRAPLNQEGVRWFSLLSHHICRTLFINFPAHLSGSFYGVIDAYSYSNVFWMFLLLISQYKQLFSKVFKKHSFSYLDCIELVIKFCFFIGKP